MEDVWKCLAAILLCGDPEMPAGNIPEPLQAAIKEVAVEWEIMDQRETLTGEWLPWLRARRAGLASAPTLSDVDRLPSRESIAARLGFNRELRDQLDVQRFCAVRRGDEYRAVIREVDQLYEAWSTMSSARTEHYYVSARRYALAWLRDEIGPAAYYSGDWPPWVPTWRFQEVPWPR